MITVKTEQGNVNIDNAFGVVTREVDKHEEEIMRMGADIERTKASVNMMSGAYRELVDGLREVNSSLSNTLDKVNKYRIIMGISLGLNIITIAMLVVHILFW